jgi:hypothetical protein
MHTLILMVNHARCLWQSHVASLQYATLDVHIALDPFNTHTHTRCRCLSFKHLSLLHNIPLTSLCALVTIITYHQQSQSQSQSTTLNNPDHRANQTAYDVCNARTCTGDEKIDPWHCVMYRLVACNALCNTGSSRSGISYNDRRSEPKSLVNGTLIDSVDANVINAVSSSGFCCSCCCKRCKMPR